MVEVVSSSHGGERASIRYKLSEGRDDPEGEGHVCVGHSDGSHEKLALKGCSLCEALFQVLYSSEVSHSHSSPPGQMLSTL